MVDDEPGDDEVPRVTAAPLRVDPQLAASEVFAKFINGGGSWLEVNLPGVVADSEHGIEHGVSCLSDRHRAPCQNKAHTQSTGKRHMSFLIPAKLRAPGRGLAAKGLVGLDGVGEVGGELGGVSFGACGGVVEVIVDCAEVEAEPPEDGKAEAGVDVRGEGLTLIEGRRDTSEFVEDERFRKRHEIPFGEGGPDEIQVLGRHEKCLFLVFDVGFDVERAAGAFEQREAGSGSVGLLEIERLREVVVEGDLAKDERAGGEILVAFGGGMKDVGLDGEDAGLRGGAVGLVVVEGGTGACGEPVDGGGCADEVDGSVEGGGVLGGADERRAAGGDASPAVEEGGWLGERSVEGGGVDEAVGLGEGDGFGAGRGGYDDLPILAFAGEADGALGDDGGGVPASDFLVGGEQGEVLVGAKLFDVGPLDGEVAGHVGLEGDGFGIGVFEDAGELLAVGKDEGVGGGGVGLREEGGRSEEENGKNEGADFGFPLD